MNVAWIGLGAMGRPMAARLADRFPTVVWNRTASVATSHASEHGTEAVELEKAAAREVVFSCLPTTADVADIVQRVTDHVQEGSIWVDATSGEPEASRRIAEALADRGVSYLDAPVSGGTAGAEAGTLTMMVGGDEAALARVRPVLEPLTSRVVHVGPVGAGHAVKAVNNSLLAVDLLAAAEGLLALTRHGVSSATALEVINGSSGRSFATDTLLAERIVTREFPLTFKLGLLAKDTGIGMRVLDAAGTPAPVLRLARELIATAAAQIGPDADHTEAVKLLEGWAGAEIR